jgi:DNA-binding response OmpR family regulator
MIKDDPAIGELLAEMLAEMGHQTCAIVATEDECAEADTRHAPDLMIVDAGLRERNGISAVEEIDRTGPIPHLFISGDATRVRTLVRSGTVVLQKPFHEAELTRAIQRTLEAGGVQALVGN